MISKIHKNLYHVPEYIHFYWNSLFLKARFVLTGKSYIVIWSNINLRKIVENDFVQNIFTKSSCYFWTRISFTRQFHISKLWKSSPLRQKRLIFVCCLTFNNSERSESLLRRILCYWASLYRYNDYIMIYHQYEFQGHFAWQ